MRLRPALAVLTAAALAPLAARAQTEEALLAPVADNTLFESPAGVLSNGAGAFLYAGRTGASAGTLRRRALVRFDPGPAVPAGAVVEEVTLRLSVSILAQGWTPQPFRLHRATAAWGEGASDAGDPGGGGAPAQAGDATWLHRTSPGARWATPGGDFAPDPSATLTVTTSGQQTWASTPALVADVQGWVDAPASNAGWVIVGNETGTQTAARFGSRENTTATSRPQLRVRFRRTVAADAPDAPGGLRLEAPVPNPWRGAATVAFRTPGGPARLDLVDALGRTVATLADGVFAAGPQTAAVRAALAPGVYVLRLTAGGHTVTRRTVVR